MKLKTLRPVLILAIATGCDSVLDVQPINQIPEERAIISPATARSAVAGMYDALQSTGYYGGTFTVFGDLPAEDVEHTGTFASWRQVDKNEITTDNTAIEPLWDALYRAIGRANIVIQRVPTVAGLDPGERDQMVGEAHFIRALTYHNLVKLWGEKATSGLGVPLRLEPAVDIPSASDIERATTSEVYAQVLSDLTEAERLMTVTDATRQGSTRAVRAIRARVLLYQQNWVAAESEAEAVAAMGLGLATNYSDLFTAAGGNTPEDILRLRYNAKDSHTLGFYYRAKGAAGGRKEVSPAVTLLLAYDPNYGGTRATYNPVDRRGQWNVAFSGSAGSTRYGSKYPTSTGTEHLHVIRFAEILLIKAEAEARQNKLGEAQASLNLIRTRAGLLGLDLVAMGQSAAIDAILHERRLELVYEGDRWPDLVRTDRAVATLGIPAFRTLFPIPQNELDVAPGLVQNPGY
ncbi:MAG: RagB/SusD family nutrient uptake outer membrane protein [Gemmatimonadetes bacterium]|nr:RagB/SusD family nutrient uptake outer membrane protein [Gemmatimonadota bacterium]